MSPRSCFILMCFSAIGRRLPQNLEPSGLRGQNIDNKGVESLVRGFDPHRLILDLDLDDRSARWISWSRSDVTTPVDSR